MTANLKVGALYNKFISFSVFLWRRFNIFHTFHQLFFSFFPKGNFKTRFYRVLKSSFDEMLDMKFQIYDWQVQRVLRQPFTLTLHECPFGFHVVCIVCVITIIPFVAIFMWKCNKRDWWNNLMLLWNELVALLIHAPQ